MTYLIKLRRFLMTCNKKDDINIWLQLKIRQEYLTTVEKWFFLFLKNSTWKYYLTGEKKMHLYTWSSWSSNGGAAVISATCSVPAACMLLVCLPMKCLCMSVCNLHYAWKSLCSLTFYRCRTIPRNCRY